MSECWSGESGYSNSRGWWLDPFGGLGKFSICLQFSSLANNLPLGRLGEQRLQNGEFILNRWRMFLSLLLEFGTNRGWDEGIGSGVFSLPAAAFEGLGFLEFG